MPLGKRLVGEHLLDEGDPRLCRLVAARVVRGTAISCITTGSFFVVVLKSDCPRHGTCGSGAIRRTMEPPVISPHTVTRHISPGSTY